MNEEDRIVEKALGRHDWFDLGWVADEWAAEAIRIAIRETARACEDAIECRGSEQAFPLRIVHTFKSRIPERFPEAFEEES